MAQWENMKNWANVAMFLRQTDSYLIVSYLVQNKFGHYSNERKCKIEPEKTVDKAAITACNQESSRNMISVKWHRLK